jgi:hypothetical protein
MKKITILVFLTFFLLVGISVYSQEPSPRVLEIQQPKQEQPEGNKRPPNTTKKSKQQETAPQTSSIKSFTVEDKAKANTDKPKHNEKTMTDWWLIGFTGVLVVVAGIQAWILWRQIIHSKRTERPWLFFTTELENRVPIIKENGSVGINVMVNIKNHGKTPAILTTLRIVVNPRETTYPPQLTKLIELSDETTIPEGIVIGAGEVYPYRTFVPLTFHEWENINNLKRFDIWLTCSGMVRYKDTVSNRIRKTGFLWQYYPHESQRRFGICNNKKLNYYT